MSPGIGIAVNNARACVEALIDKTSPMEITRRLLDANSAIGTSGRDARFPCHGSTLQALPGFDPGGQLGHRALAGQPIT